MAKEYQASKLLPWRIYMESYSFLRWLGPIKSLKVLDLACGEGYYTRKFRREGAQTVVGVDVSPSMIDLARAQEQNDQLGITYHVADASKLALVQEFDLVGAAYLLNYAQNKEQLLSMCQVIADHLRLGGRFVTINSNPTYHAPASALYHYGFTSENKGTHEGDPVIYKFYKEDGSYISVTNFHLKKETYEWGLRKVGFKDITWHHLEISPEGIDMFGKAYWEIIMHEQPVIGLSCRKA